jgi:phosphohistidine phosphatase
MRAARTLVLLRHAKSAWPKGMDDADRPLSGRGERNALVAGQWLREHVPGIEAVVCSPALRTLLTWRLVSGELDVRPAFRLEPRIYAATVRDLITVVRGLPADATTALLVGHNPGLSEVVGAITDTEFEFRTAAIAVLRAEGAWTDAAPRWATLERTATPR